MGTFCIVISISRKVNPMTNLTLGDYATTVPLGSKSVFFDKIPVKIFDQHRTAFYHWGTWSSDLKVLPNLVTIDAHSDCQGDKNMKPLLDKYLSQPRGDLIRSFFTSFCLCKTNDSHIATAIESGYLDNTFALTHNDDYELPQNDNHSIFLKNDMEIFFKLLHQKTRENPHIYLDIDLDYFACERGYGEYDLKPWRTIRDELLTIRKNIFQSNSYCIHGITIATEPFFCGSIRNSNFILKMVDRILFDGKILTSCCNYE